MDVEHLPDDEEAEGEQQGGGFQPGQLASYLGFAGRAVRKRRLLSGLIFLAVTALTIVAVAVLPRTYHCETKLMAQYDWALEYKQSAPRPFDGAVNLIMRHENLLNIVKRADLLESWERARPPLSRLKDRISRALRGDPGEAARLDALVAYLEGKLVVTVPTETTLNIAIDWPDAAAAAHVIEVARDTFLESRHASEISTIQEKISILDSHSTRLRNEIEAISSQIHALKTEKLAEVGREAQPKGSESTPAAVPVAAPRRVAPRADAGTGENVAAAKEELARLKDDLEARKRAISDLEADRNRRLLEAQARLTDLESKYTPAHPLVHEAQQLVDSLSHESARVTGLRAEARDIEAKVKDLTLATTRPVESLGGGGAAAAAANAGAAAPAPANADVLPTEILKALDDGSGVDPAISAQLQTAVGKYTALRSELGTARIELDTAQAAFNRRYQVVMPAQVPTKPSKPKIPKVIGIGIFLAVLLGLLVPVGAELRTGRIVERWQVYHLDLPLLAELRFPPGPRA